MESIQNTMRNIMQDAPSEMDAFAELIKTNRVEAIKDIVEAYNSETDEEGMKELPCDLCHGKGRIEIFNEEKQDREQIECKCMKARRALRFVTNLGLLKDVQKCSFESYEPYDDATRDMKQAALDYSNNFEDRWLFLGGQSGAGKTHLAYSIFGKMVKRSIAPVWMRWIQDSQDLKMMIGEDDYDREVKRLQTASVLIIDDFFNLTPTEADIRLARVIIDHRYTNKLPTIITTELTLGEIDNYDDAIAGRIAEMSVVYQIGGKNHNYRMRNFR